METFKEADEGEVQILSPQAVKNDFIESFNTSDSANGSIDVERVSVEKNSETAEIIDLEFGNSQNKTLCSNNYGESEINRVKTNFINLGITNEVQSSPVCPAQSKQALKKKKNEDIDHGEDKNFKKPKISEENIWQNTDNQPIEKEITDPSYLIDNQVQCVNLHCQSGFDLALAPVFVLTYFNVAHRKNVLQKACRECFDIALKHQEKMCDLLKNNISLLTCKFPSQKDDVVVMDSVDEIREEEILPESVISVVEEQLLNLINDAIDKYNVNYQIEKAQEILSKKYEDLDVSKQEINNQILKIEHEVKKARLQIYQAFTPKLRHLQPISIPDPNERIKPKNVYEKKPAKTVKSVTEILEKFKENSSTLPETFETQNSEAHDVVALKEVEIPKVKLPPIGKLVCPVINIGMPVYVIKATVFGVWVKARVVEILPKSEDGVGNFRVRFEASYRGITHKNVTGKQLAYRKPSRFRYPVGTRVIALFFNSEAPSKSAYYAGVVAEPPKILNSFRYLVFFDDGYAQYVMHDKIFLVCECSRQVHEDVHSDSRDFIKSYLDQYPERPMVKLQQRQLVKTEWNGKWWAARVVTVDGSLAKMHFEAEGRTEWIYRGSTRLGPLYSELVAAAARKEQGALSRHRSLGIASLKKRNMPYVEYSVDQDDIKSPTTPTVSKNVAKKSTASRQNIQSDNSFVKLTGPLKPNEKVEYTSKGYVRTMKLPSRIKGRVFSPHQCGPSCVKWTEFAHSSCKGINPLAIPLLYGFERQTVRGKGKKSVMYCAPCGRRLRNILEMHRYLRITKCAMGLDYFDFDHWVRILDEFHIESNMFCTHFKDISYGHENTPVSCVNEIDNSWPSFMDYSTSRIPQEGVNICLDEEFLVCCSCTDDCLDKEKCECWQLTIEGTKLGPGKQIDPNAGYHYKRLLEPVTTGIYECNQRCKCGPSCLNRVAQNPLQLNLQVFKTLRKGWGLRTLNDIPQGGFICIYAGRLHTEQSANDDGRMYGDEYLAELDYIEVVERFKEGYESEVIEPDAEKENEPEGFGEDAENQDEQDEMDESHVNNDDIDYVPEGLGRLPHTENVVNTRGRNKKITTEEKSESESEREKEEVEIEKEFVNADEDDDEMNKKPSKFTAEVPVNEKNQPRYKSVREMFGDGADDCYIMDAKSSGNIGRYLNHSCQPNVFVQNVFVDTHDVRFPWVAFFALTYIKAGTELTWDYNYDIGSVPGKVLYCYCNSAECRGRLL